ncbi:MYXO-CTERM sorting domain-containing protein [Nonomuraea sp. NPDC049625]
MEERPSPLALGLLGLVLGRRRREDQASTPAT